MHWPTAAAACFIRSWVGRSGRPILAVPMPMAPDETRMISWPIPSRSERVRESRSMLYKLSRPVSWVRVEVPTFTTTRRRPSFLAMTVTLLFKILPQFTIS